MASRDSLSPKSNTSNDSLSPTRQHLINEYRRQRKRVLQAVRRQQVKGIDVKVKVPKLNIKQSKTATIKKTVTQLKKITPEQIRKESKRKSNKETKQKPSKESKYNPSNEKGFDKHQAQLDEANKTLINTVNEFANQFELGKITYRKMLDIIDGAKKSDKYWGWKYLEKLLNTEINNFNFEPTMMAIASYDQSEVLRAAELACYSSSQTEVMAHIGWLSMVIKGTIPTAQEAKEISDVMDKDEAYTAPSE